MVGDELAPGPPADVVVLMEGVRGPRSVDWVVPLGWPVVVTGGRVVEVGVGRLVEIEVDVVRMGRVTVVDGSVGSGTVGRGRDVGTVSEVVGAVGSGKAATGSTARSP